MHRIFVAFLLISVVFLPACDESLPAPSDPPAKPATDLTPAELELLEAAEPLKNMPAEADLPVPPDGWRTIELDGDEIEVFRDEFGVPHVFAPSVEAAFRAQGYVITEDRTIQLLEARESVSGWRSARVGPGGLGHDRGVRIRGYTEDEYQAFWDALPPCHRELMSDYLRGVNLYIERHVPEMPPVNVMDFMAGVVRYMRSPGDVFGGQQFEMRKLLSLVKFLRGEEFMYNMLDDCLPLDVPNSPTTDHSCNGKTRIENVESISRPLRYQPEDLAEIYKNHSDFIKLLQSEGQFTKWGSQAWAVSAERSTSGKAMLFSGPMLGFHTPPQGALIHLSAPGFHVAGLCFTGSPGIVMGHNEHVAWGITSGMVVQTDMFVETINPDNSLQYWYNGQWKDMEVFEWPIPVRQPDGSLTVERFQTQRTVHGPIVHRVPYNNIAYARNSSFLGKEVDSFRTLLDMNFAHNLGDIEEAIRHCWTSQNFIAADRAGNIGYWLGGRIPIRHPGQDPRLPAPGTGEYDWRGYTVASDLVRCVNPKQGWLGNFNNKPSIKTPGWWPELMWGHQIHKMLRENNPIDWDTFVDINRVNGEHYFAGPFMKPYLLKLLKERGGDDARVMRAARMLEAWPDNNVPGQSAVLIFQEWMLDTMMELLTPDFKGLVSRDMSINNMQIFGLLTFRILCPDRAGFALKNDYLHGRDKDEIAYRCFLQTLDRLEKKHGPDMDAWPYQPEEMKMGELDPFPARNCGVFWMCTELAEKVRAMDLIIPGQSGHHQSPHFKDQRPLFDDWQLKSAYFYREDLPPRG